MKITTKKITVFRQYNVTEEVLQLVVDGEDRFYEGGKNCFGEDVPVQPVIVTKESLKQCKTAAKKGYFRVRNFEYNGYFGRNLEGYSTLTPKLDELTLTSDPGVYKYEHEGNVYYIPWLAIEGYQLLLKVTPKDYRPALFGPACIVNHSSNGE